MNGVFYVNSNIFRRTPKLGRKLWKLPAQEIIKQLPKDEFSHEIEYIKDLIQELPKNSVIKIMKPESNLNKFIKKVIESLPWRKTPVIDMTEMNQHFIPVPSETVRKAFCKKGLSEGDVIRLVSDLESNGVKTEEDLIQIAYEMDKTKQELEIEKLKPTKHLPSN